MVVLNRRAYPSYMRVPEKRASVLPSKCPFCLTVIRVDGNGDCLSCGAPLVYINKLKIGVGSESRPAKPAPTTATKVYF